ATPDNGSPPDGVQRTATHPSLTRIERIPVRTTMRRATLLLFALTAGCGTSDARTSWQATVDTVGDTIIVRTTAGSAWGEERVLVPEVAIGVLEGEDAYMLGSITGI